MDKIVFSSPISINEILTSHCGSLSTHHYHLTYHPCFDMQFVSARPHKKFSRCCHVFEKKAKAIKLPFCAKEKSKKKKGNCFDKDWADRYVASEKESGMTGFGGGGNRWFPQAI